MKDELSEQIITRGLERWGLLTKQAEEATAEAASVLQAVQGACDHPDSEIFEAVVTESYLRFRVCRRCGYSEHPKFWDEYYLLERSNVPKLPLEDARLLRRGKTLESREVEDLVHARRDGQRRLAKELCEAHEDAERAARGE